MNYRQNIRYFKSLNYPAVIIFGVIGIVLLKFLVSLGILILFGLGLYIFLKIYLRPDDADIDKVYESEIQSIIEVAYEKLGLVKSDANELDPLVLSGPSFKGFTIWRKGKDGVVRSSSYEVAVLLFGKKQIYIYYYSFSIIGNVKNERLDEYFYKDIVSLSTSSTSTTYNDHVMKREDQFNLELMTISTSGSAHLTCSMSDSKGIEDHIEEAKQLLRQRK